MKAQSKGLDSLPMISLIVNGNKVKALVDTGCSITMIEEKAIGKYDVCSDRITAFDGNSVICRGRSVKQLTVGHQTISVEVIVVDKLLDGVDVVLGMDSIELLGGVCVYKENVVFGFDSTENFHEHPDPDVKWHIKDDQELDKPEIVVDDVDFSGELNNGVWTVRWKWKENLLPNLVNRVDCYDKSMSPYVREKFAIEVEKWISEGILVPCEKKVTQGIIPLMAVDQTNKGKVRPVLDFRELNKYVACHTGDDVMDVCGQRLREWRRMEGDAALVDLKGAYLQIRIAKDLWKYQIVNYNNQSYYLTRLGFGLNCAPRIMSKILKTVLSCNRIISQNVSSYIDDIYVNESEISTIDLVNHLKCYGLISKEPESIENNTVLGLKIYRGKHNELRFGRGNQIPEVSDCLTRREIFSICGKLVGHYPVAGWLRVACSVVKRYINGIKWDETVSGGAITVMKRMVKEVKTNDPVDGLWYVQKRKEGRVWCDASKVALGVALEIEASVVEDAAWLRKKDDYAHINVSELDAVIKGINLAVKWDLTNITVMSDSATVCSWVNSVIAGETRVHTTGAAEMIIRRRLGTLKDVIDEFKLTVKMMYVHTTKNIADGLTRVRKEWWKELDSGHPGDVDEDICCAVGEGNQLQQLHDMHHFGVERTLFLAKKIDPNITKSDVEKVVKECERCRRIDPSPMTGIGGELSVSDNWKRLAIDITHYRGIPYLSMIDCGPSRFAVWRELTNERAENVVRELNSLFLEMGPVDTILMDNGTQFRSALMIELLQEWNITPYYRAAYRPTGNGIIERSHRTIKVIAERSNISPLKAVFWYNSSPKTRQEIDSVPQRALFRYEWRHPAKVPDVEEISGETQLKVGDEVWTKPPDHRCTTLWKPGVVTRLNTPNNISVDGVPRHVLDIREAVSRTEGLDENDEREVSNRDQSRPVRDRRQPAYLADFVQY